MKPSNPVYPKKLGFLRTRKLRKSGGQVLHHPNMANDLVRQMRTGNTAIVIGPAAVPPHGRREGTGANLDIDRTAGIAAAQKTVIKTVIEIATETETATAIGIGTEMPPERGTTIGQSAEMEVDPAYAPIETAMKEADLEPGSNGQK